MDTPVENFMMECSYKIDENCKEHYYEIAFTSDNKAEILALLSAVSGTNATLGLAVDPIYPIIERCEHGTDLIEDNCWDHCDPNE